MRDQRMEGERIYGRSVGLLLASSVLKNSNCNSNSNCLKAP
jgi:hypothetical protein